jgi:hypothetical protein
VLWIGQPDAYVAKRGASPWHPAVVATIVSTAIVPGSRSQAEQIIASVDGEGMTSMTGSVTATSVSGS